MYLKKRSKTRRSSVGSNIRVYETLFHAYILDTFYDNLKVINLVSFYVMDENIKRLRPLPNFLLSFEIITKLARKKSGGIPTLPPWLRFWKHICSQVICCGNNVFWFSLGLTFAFFRFKTEFFQRFERNSSVSFS
jgi:hypothetical protein